MFGDNDGDNDEDEVSDRSDFLYDDDEDDDFNDFLNNISDDDIDHVSPDEYGFDDVEAISRREHALKVLTTLNDQRKNSGASLDLEIKILIDENVVLLPVHKVLVSACCPYIRNCLDNMPETQVSTIDLSHLNGGSVTEIIDWIYTGVCNLTTKTAPDILISAAFMGINRIVKLSVDFISSNTNLTYENCSDMYKLSYSYKAFRFREKVWAYILPKFYTLFSESHLDGLPMEDILDISSSDDLILFSHKFIDLDPADHEFKLFQMIREYLETKNLQDFWFDFLTKSIRVIHLTVDQINDLIKDQRWLGNCTKKGECIDLLQDVRDKKEQNSLDFKYQIPLVPRKHLKGFKYQIAEVINIPGLFHSTDPVHFNHLDSERERLKNSEALVMVRGMKIFYTKWNGNTVIGGMEVTYTDGSKYSHGLNEDVLELGIEEFQLKDGEYIRKVECFFDRVFYGITVYTNFRKKYGQRGRNARLGFNYDPPQNYKFLAAIYGKTTTSRNVSAFAFINFYWGQLPNKNLKMYF